MKQSCTLDAVSGFLINRSFIPPIVCRFFLTPVYGANRPPVPYVIAERHRAGCVSGR